MISIDIEASGTNYEKHSILSLGALDVAHPENRIYLECQAWEGAHVDPEALAVNGFTEEEATDDFKQTEAQLVAQFIHWSEGLEDRTLAGQNVSFDRDFVRAACERAGYHFPFAHRTVDTHSLAYIHMVHNGFDIPLEREHSALTLNTILEYVGIPEEPEPHNALTGALSHAEVIARLLYGKKLLPEFASYDVPPHVRRNHV